MRATGPRTPASAARSLANVENATTPGAAAMPATGCSVRTVRGLRVCVSTRVTVPLVYPETQTAPSA